MEQLLRSLSATFGPTAYYVILLIVFVLAITWLFLPFFLWASNTNLSRINTKLETQNQRLDAVAKEQIDRSDQSVELLKKIHQQLMLQNKLLADARPKQKQS